MTSSLPPQRRPLTSSLPPGLEEIDSSWNEEESPTMGSDASERVTQVPSIPSDQFARRLMQQVASEPPDLPGPTLVATPPEPHPLDDDEIFDRETLLDPLELLAPPPSFETSQGVARHTAIAPVAPRPEPPKPRVRGLSDLPPVLRFGGIGAAVGSAAAATSQGAAASQGTSAATASSQGTSRQEGPSTRRPSAWDLGHEPPRPPTAGSLGPPRGSITSALTFSRAPTNRPDEGDRDSSELEFPLEAATYEAARERASYETSFERSPSAIPLQHESSLLGTVPSLAPLPAQRSHSPSSQAPSSHSPSSRSPSSHGRIGGGFELDLDEPPGRALELAKQAALTPVRSGLELAQRFSSIPPPSTRPARDMLDRYAMGDFSGALSVAEKILEGDPAHEDALRCAQSCRDVLGDMYASRIGDLEQVLSVAMSPDQIRWLSLDHRAGFLLSMIDGVSTVDELLDVCGMQRLDALRIICNLLDQRVVSLTP